jgi:hypothetical protein
MEKIYKRILIFGLVIVLIITVLYVLNYPKGYIEDKIFNLDCNNSIDNYYNHPINTSYEEMTGFLNSKHNCSYIDIMPNYCKNCMDYSGPLAYYCPEEDKFWVIQAPGFGIKEDTDFYGPFQGYPCIDYRKD